jgi:broad specificity phosphatase PhoE
LRLLFIRHAESEANRLRIISNRGRRHGLTPLGQSQAEALAARLGTADLTAVYHSPLLRAEQTAASLAASSILTPQAVDALREYDCGVLEGCSNPATWLRYETVLVQWLRHGDLDHRPEGGESFNDIRGRFLPFVAGLVAQYGASNAAIALVGHGGLYRLMLPLVLSNVGVAFAMQTPIPHCGVITAEMRSEALVAVDWCGTPPE